MSDRIDDPISDATSNYRVDPMRERLLALRRLAAWHLKRTGEALHRSVPYRWAQAGVNGVRLPTVRIGGALYTSEEALTWWFAELNGGREA